ncbi:MAG: small basic protein [Phycisphaeraceae bacterium]|nr:small basic protein [Phycisphaeraceae bacterium]
MSIDRSLKTAGNLARHRNVLSRAERIERLAHRKSFDRVAGDPLGLPKVANRKVVTGGKAKKKEEAAAPGAEAAAPAAAAPAAAAPVAKADAKAGAKAGGKKK